MIKLYLAFLIIFYSTVNAQGLPQSTLDSIAKNLKDKTPKQRCLFFLEKADYFSNSNAKLSYSYSQEGLKEALKTQNDSLLGLAYNTLGNTQQYLTQLDSSLYYHEKALLYREKTNDVIGIADSYNNIGIAYDSQGNFDNALKYYFKALKCYEKNHNDDKTAMTLANIGVVYKSQKEYKKAYHYYKRAYDIYKKINSEFGITVTSGNLGSILINFKSYNNSLAYSKIAKEGYEKLDYKRYVAYPIANIAIVYDSLHRFKEANKNYIEAIQLHEIHKNDYEVANTCNAYSSCLIKQGNYSESIIYAQKALQYAQNSDTYFLEVTAYANLAKAFAKIKNFEKAYYYSNLHNKGMDSLFKKEKTKAVFEVEAKYENEKKSKLLLQIQNKIQHRNTLVAILSLLAVSIALISYLIYRQQKIKEQQREQEYELQRAIAAIETQNKLQEQRITISRDLHDNIGAQLTFIISSINNIKHAFDINNSKLEQKLQLISAFTKTTILELRDTIWAMNTKEITCEDLRHRIYNFIEKAKLVVNNIHFSFEIDPLLSHLTFDGVDGMNIYRVTQEAVHNSIKYAQATEIKVNISQIEKHIVITIADNGVGFDANTVILGNGIYNIKKRVNDMQGTVEINSENNKGTNIVIHFPNQRFEK
ncbi:sensor histidine kinase [Flavobacterium sp.]|uniref:tetratricopeptide repeat-containing sensor histidine kinase n=1 Tax=Flavobacterium sp. TaxID=239 RepID=UPI002611D327|nr:sensor histidine kinase [Flavobacterium sp.]MDD3005300.1 sensor histidine kinase [Flavobacterium sp.]